LFVLLFISECNYKPITITIASLLDNANSNPESADPFSNENFGSSNNKSGLQDNLMEINNSSAKSNNGAFFQPINKFYRK
jgi:hypothetical protein